MWDVFISHASEDKDSIARPLAEALTAVGIRVWYDDFTLGLGDSLSRSINRGLAQSRYGVVILSPSFFANEWPQRELDGLSAREAATGKVILPVWHQVTRAEVLRHSPILADKLAVSTEKGVPFVADQVIGVLKGHAPGPRSQAATGTIAGDWQAQVTYDWGASYTERLSFTLLAGEVHGTASYLGTDRGILEAKISGSKLTFLTQSEEVMGGERNSRTVVHRYIGLVSEDEIRFILQSEGGFSPNLPVEFTARRVP